MATTKRFIARVGSESQYESAASRLSKFAFLNHLTFKQLEQLLAGREITGQARQDPQSIAKAIEDGKYPGAEAAKRLAALFDLRNPDGIARMFPSAFRFGNDDYYRNSPRHCPECDKTGFHSPLFDVAYLEMCPIHRVKLSNECPVCGKSGFSVTKIGLPFECKNGHLLWEARDRNTWPPALTPKQEAALEEAVWFLEQINALVHRAIDVLGHHVEAAYRGSSTIPIAAAMLGARAPLVEMFSTTPLHITETELTPHPELTARGATLEGDYLHGIAQRVRGERRGLEDAYYRYAAMDLFNEVDREIKEGIDEHHEDCVAFAKFLPPHTNLARWMTWCPLMNAKYRWNRHWGMHSDELSRAYAREGTAYWEILKNLISPVDFQALLGPDVTDAMTDQEAGTIFMETCAALYLPPLRETYIKAVLDSEPKGNDPTPEYRIERMQSELPTPHGTHYLFSTVREDKTVKIVVGTDYSGYTGIAELIARCEHDDETSAIIVSAVNALWKQYVEARDAQTFTRSPDKTEL